jgi:hypothetical protein
VGIEPEFGRENSHSILLNYIADGYFIRTDYYKLIRE